MKKQKKGAQEKAAEKKAAAAAKAEKRKKAAAAKAAADADEVVEEKAYFGELPALMLSILHPDTMAPTVLYCPHDTLNLLIVHRLPPAPPSPSSWGALYCSHGHSTAP